MHENRDFGVPVNILTPFARAPFSWATLHTTVCLDTVERQLSKCQIDYSIGVFCPLLYTLLLNSINVRMLDYM